MKKRKLLKRGLVSLLVAVLAVGLLPVMPGNTATVQAAGGDKTIAGLGTGIIANPTAPTASTDTWKGSYVYFGTYDGNPVKYRVLDNNTSVFGGTTMLLDCDSILWAGSDPSSAFDDDSNDWANSNIRTYLNKTFLTSNFSPAEHSAIAGSTKSAKDSTDGNGWDGVLSYAPLSTDKIFFLDAKEATNTSYGYCNTKGIAENRKKTGGNAYWWLRSADTDDTKYAGFVYSDGDIGDGIVYANYVGVSPAFNINLSSVLFTSAISGTAGDTEAEYKLTLLDSDMTIAGNGDVTRSGDTVTVPYTISGRNSANATKVSVLITDKVYTDGNAQILHYGALDTSAGNGTGSFTLSSNLSDKVCGSDYYAYIIAEDVNGEKETDYASTPVSITVPASKYALTVTNGSGSGQYAQGETVTITASAAPGGQQFKEWEIVSGNITLASSTSETTSFTMPAEEVSVKAIYEAYDILDGANSSWTQNTDGSLSIRGSGTFSKFVGVKVDGTLVDGKNYTVKEGSTIVTLKTDYLNTISVGIHTFEILWTDGSASTTFAIKADTPEDGNQKDDVPKTGDNSNPALWLTLLVVSLAGFSGMLVKNKRKDCN